MKITIIQPDIIWENKEENLKRYENLIRDHHLFFNGEENIIILPEMFTTGFTMNPEELAEEIDGTTTKWMHKIAETYNSAIIGSIIAKNDPASSTKDNKYYNRLYCIEPNGMTNYYNKRHLFTYAGEDKSYTSGNHRQIIEFCGWRILLLICYDLRFPVWSRNKGDYDMIIYVANWPEKRQLAWEVLLQARAIENQCYVIGVNRIGKDANNNKYSGGSCIINPLGEVQYQIHNTSVINTSIIDLKEVIKVRENFPFLKDSDEFKI